jgi:hypothetical protein
MENKKECYKSYELADQFVESYMESLRKYLITLENDDKRIECLLDLVYEETISNFTRNIRKINNEKR